MCIGSHYRHGVNIFIILYSMHTLVYNYVQPCISIYCGVTLSSLVLLILLCLNRSWAQIESRARRKCPVSTKHFCSPTRCSN